MYNSLLILNNRMSHCFILFLYFYAEKNYLNTKKNLHQQPNFYFSCFSHSWLLSKWINSSQILVGKYNAHFFYYNQNILIERRMKKHYNWKITFHGNSSSQLNVKYQSKYSSLLSNTCKTWNGMLRFSIKKAIRISIKRFSSLILFM